MFHIHLDSLSSSYPFVAVFSFFSFSHFESESSSSKIMRINFFVCARNNGKPQRNVFRLRTEIRFQLAPFLCSFNITGSLSTTADDEQQKLLALWRFFPFASIRHHVSVVIIYHYSYMLIALWPGLVNWTLDTLVVVVVIMSHRQQWVEWRDPKIVFHMTLSN